jgi:hypothetical protein
MLYLLDTNAFSDVMVDDPRVRTRMAALKPSDQVVACTIVKGEIFFGIKRLAPGKRRDDLEARAAKVSIERSQASASRRKCPSITRRSSWSDPVLSARSKTTTRGSRLLRDILMRYLSLVIRTSRTLLV